MYTILNSLQIRERLNEAKIKFVTINLFSQMFKVSTSKTKYFIERQIETGLFVRLKNGLFALKTDFPREEEVANALYSPSYISLEYALAHYGLLPEMVYIVTSVTTKPTRSFEVNDKQYYYRRIKKQAYTGYFLEKTDTKSYLMATPEKAIADYLYFLAQGKIPANDRLFANIVKINKSKVLEHIKLFDHQLTIDKLNQIYARS